MLTLTLTSKNAVHDLKRRFRTVMDAHGIRLGSTNKKIDSILPQLFDVRDIDTMYGLAEKSNRTTAIGDVDQRRLGGSTYKQKDELKHLLRQLDDEEGIAGITVGRRNNVGCNKFGLTFCIETKKGIRRVDTGLTLEREPRELEVLNIFYQIKDYGLEESVKFAAHPVGDDRDGYTVDFNTWSSVSLIGNLSFFLYTMALGDFDGSSESLARAERIMRLDKWHEVVA
ncbi:hypothetical protein [Idiomarina abyssalis]|uniref:Uncharacterized protein n=1 Tax=Idiomarina abyssalis TaxID=86102 RepID=A0A8I1G6R8_9GAMM|nr:hypothetical protein [Idiomarina abyssalis]MBJ7265517.1 hypothetical protein [Idiomarina abyssalis]MBJ7316809.1 hypothetical protein [Idiomarina abyssalis]